MVDFHRPGHIFSLSLLTAVALSVPSNKAYGMLRDKETSQLKIKSMKVYPPYTRPYITQLHVCSCNILGNIRGLNL